jgi:hypothetical protein
MGILDSLPHPWPPLTPELCEALETSFVRWRWRLREQTARLSRTHGDFHPWNILFQQGTRFVVLDRSRGEWGEPADDVAALTMNYVFFSLLRSGRVEGALQTLFVRFWLRYLAATHDDEMRRVVAPFLAFRALVMASPVWYPRLPGSVRLQLVSFTAAVLGREEFEPTRIGAYF